MLHDALAHPDVLTLAARAEKIAVGKRCGKFATAQQFISAHGRIGHAARSLPRSLRANRTLNGTTPKRNQAGAGRWTGSSKTRYNSSF